MLAVRNRYSSAWISHNFFFSSSGSYQSVSLAKYGATGGVRKYLFLVLLSTVVRFDAFFRSQGVGSLLSS